MAGLYRDVIVDERGNERSEATVTVYESDGTTLATLYVDAAESDELANPLPHVAAEAPGIDPHANVLLWAASGNYVMAAALGATEYLRWPFDVGSASEAGLFVTDPDDATPVQSDISPNADPVLTIPNIPVGAHALSGYLAYDSPVAADFRIGWTFDGTATMRWTTGGLASSAVAAAGSIDTTDHALTDEAVIGGAGAVVVARPSGLLVVIAAGDLTLRWAQGTSTAADTLRSGGSWVRLQQVA